MYMDMRVSVCEFICLQPGTVLLPGLNLNLVNRYPLAGSRGIAVGKASQVVSRLEVFKVSVYCY